LEGGVERGVLILAKRGESERGVGDGIPGTKQGEDVKDVDVLRIAVVDLWESKGNGVLNGGVDVLGEGALYGGDAGTDGVMRGRGLTDGAFVPPFLGPCELAVDAVFARVDTACHNHSRSRNLT
jgi:hypothetical protein